MKSIPKERYAGLIKEKAREFGFDHCGIARADYLEEEAPRLEKWLNQGMHGKMSYMANHFEKRLDPRKLVEGAKSVISLMYNYYPEKELDSEFKIAKYAYGEDYHFVIKRKLKSLVAHLQQEIGEINGRVFVDSAPVHERAWAQKAGLGWIGKNSLLLNKQRGSFFFLAELIIDLELTPDSPVPDFCGTCTKCMDACPTDAIPDPYVVDASRCISYFSIELKDAIPVEMKGKFEDWIFGCDICQDVCPWNRFARPHVDEDLAPAPELSHFTKTDWEELTEETFHKVFKKSALKRTKFSGLKRNIKFVREDDGNQSGF